MESFAKFFVDSEWSTKNFGDLVTVGGENYYYGINAFSSLDKALDARAEETVTITLLRDVTESFDADRYVEFINDLTIDGSGTDTVTMASGKDYLFVNNNADGRSTVTIGENVAFDVNNVFYVGWSSGADKQGLKMELNGKVKAGEFYVSYGSEVNASKTATITTKNGLYLHGNKNSFSSTTVEQDGPCELTVVGTDGTYSMTNAQVTANYVSVFGGVMTFTDTFVKVGSFVSLYNFKDDTTAGAKRELVLDNTTLTANGDLKMAKPAGASELYANESYGTLTLKNAAVMNMGGNAIIDSTSKVAISGSTFGIGNTLTNAGTITIDAAGTLTAGTVASTGTIEVDMTNANEAVYKLVDAANESSYAAYKFVEGKDNGYKLTVSNNDLFATKADMSTLAVNADFAELEFATPVTVDGVTYYCGLNAFASVGAALAAKTADTATIKVASDTTDDTITSLKGVALVKADEVQDSVSVQSDYADDWIYFGNTEVGEGVIFSGNKVFFRGLIGDTAIDGKVIVSKEATQGFDVTVTISETGSLDIADYYGIRYNANMASGDYIVGTAELDTAKVDRVLQLKSGALNFFSGTLSLKNTKAEMSSVLMDNTKDRAIAGYEESSAAMVLENTYLDISGQTLLKGVASISLTDSTLTSSSNIKLFDADTAMTLNNSNAALDGVLLNSGYITMDAASKIVSAGVANTGVITVDMTGADQYVYKLIDCSQNAEYGVKGTNYLFSNANGYSFVTKENDLYAAITSLAVNAGWSDKEPGAEVFVDGVAYSFGYTAFTSVADAVASAAATAIAAAGFQTTIKLASDTIDDTITSLKGVALVKADEVQGSVSVQSDYADDWIYFGNTEVGEGVVFSGNKVFFRGSIGDTTIDGKVIVSKEATQGFDVTVTISETGSLDVADYYGIRYNANMASGDYIVGTAELDTAKVDRVLQLKSGALNFFSGTLSLKNTKAEMGEVWIDNTIDRAIAGYEESSAAMVLDNTYLDVSGKTTLNGVASISLTDSTLTSSSKILLSGADTAMTLANSTAMFGGALINSGTVSVGTDSFFAAAGIKNAGSINVTAGDLEVAQVVNNSVGEFDTGAGKLENSGIIAIDADGTLYTDNLTNEADGSITIAMGGVIGFNTISVASKIALTGFTELVSGAILVMDYTGSTATYTVDAYAELLNIAGADKSKFLVADNDLYYVGAEYSVYVNSEYTAQSCGGHTWGVDAFNNLTDAKEVFPAKITFDGGTYSGSTGYIDLDCYKTVIEDGTYNKLITAGERFPTGAQRQWEEVYGDTDLTINGGTFNSNVIGGSQIYDNGSLDHIGNVTLTINGGTFNAAVAGGVYFNKLPTYIRDMVILTGDVTLTINGGTFNSRVYGGCYSYTDSKNTTMMYVDGKVDLIINATDTDIVFNNDVVAGSRKYGGVTGGTCVTLTGDAGKMTFNGKAISGGSGGDVIFSDGTVDSWVDGSRKLQMTGLNGELDARLTMFSDVAMTGNSVVELTAENSRLDLVKNWEVEAGCTLSGIECNNFTNDTLALTNVNLTGEDSWTVFEGVYEDSMTGWDSFKGVTINGAAASFDGTVWSCGEENNFQLGLDENDSKKLIVTAKLA